MDVLKNSIVITAPHSLCPADYTHEKNKQNRQCDIAAGKIGLFLAEQFSKNIRDKNIIFLAANVKREKIDLNRANSRKSEYRKKLNNCLVNCSFIIDVHSFPNYYLEEAGDINFFKKDELPQDIVIISGMNNTDKQMANDLYNLLKNNNVHTRLITHLKVNDILNNANEYNKNGILLEFNEKFLEFNDKNLYKIVRLIVSWYKKLQ